MQTRYISVWKMSGANRIADSPPKSYFVSFENPTLEATITHNPEPHFFHIDRSTALRAGLLKGLFAPSDEGSLEERLAAETERMRANRAKQTKSGVFVVFEGETDVAITEFRARQDTDEFGVCLDSVDKTKIRENFQAFIQAVLAALQMKLQQEADPRIEKIGEATYLVDSSGKPIYPFTMEALPVRASVSSPLSSSDIMHAASHASYLVEEHTIRGSINLLITSLDKSIEELPAFIAAWSALEEFIKATFTEVYKTHWREIREDRSSESAQQHLKHPNNLGEKSPLADKFVILSWTLDRCNVADDKESFDDIYNTRNTLFHEGTFPERFPVEATQRLLLKYMRLHLQRKSDG